jgi:hypothetical protein
MSDEQSPKREKNWREKGACYTQPLAANVTLGTVPFRAAMIWEDCDTGRVEYEEVPILGVVSSLTDEYWLRDRLKARGPSSPPPPPAAGAGEAPPRPAESP